MSEPIRILTRLTAVSATLGAVSCNYVREDLQFAELSMTWWRKSQDRAGWRAAIECLLQRT